MLSSIQENRKDLLQGQSYPMALQCGQCCLNPCLPFEDILHLTLTDVDINNTRSRIKILWDKDKILVYHRKYLPFPLLLHSFFNREIVMCLKRGGKEQWETLKPSVQATSFWRILSKSNFQIFWDILLALEMWCSHNLIQMTLTKSTWCRDVLCWHQPQEKLNFYSCHSFEQIVNHT